MASAEIDIFRDRRLEAVQEIVEAHSEELKRTRSLGRIVGTLSVKKGASPEALNPPAGALATWSGVPLPLRTGYARGTCGENPIRVFVADVPPTVKEALIGSRLDPIKGDTAIGFRAEAVEVASESPEA